MKRIIVLGTIALCAIGGMLATATTADAQTVSTLDQETAQLLEQTLSALEVTLTSIQADIQSQQPQLSKDSVSIFLTGTENILFSLDGQLAALDTDAVVMTQPQQEGVGSEQVMSESEEVVGDTTTEVTTTEKEGSNVLVSTGIVILLVAILGGVIFFLTGKRQTKALATPQQTAPVSQQPTQPSNTTQQQSPQPHTHTQ